MATATKKEFIPPIVVPQFTVTLELSKEEAQELRNVLSKVSGAGPRRSRLNAVSDALATIGFYYESPSPGTFEVLGYKGALETDTDTDRPKVVNYYQEQLKAAAMLIKPRY